MKGFIATDADGFSAIYSEKPVRNSIDGIGHCYVPVTGARVPLTTPLTSGIGESHELTLADIFGVPKGVIRDAEAEPIEVFFAICKAEDVARAMSESEEFAPAKEEVKE